MKAYIERCLEGESLTVGEAAAALERIMTGQATDAQIAGLLVALHARGETTDELVGFAQTMREHALKIAVSDESAVDVCGTGGDALGTFNISTTAAIVVAGAGVTVAKHGNSSVSSRSGSADLFSALGVNVRCAPETVRACIDSVGIGFLFAPMFHPAMKYAAKPRKELGLRTIFNLLGPLTNPAGVHKQLIGTYDTGAAQKLAEAAARLSTVKTCVVHGREGMDEVSLCGETTVYEVDRLKPPRVYAIGPSDFGLPVRTLSGLAGGTPEENAAIARRVLAGEHGPARDVVLANAAFGIYVSGRASGLLEGRAMAAESVDSGRALGKLEEMVEFTNR